MGEVVLDDQRLVVHPRDSERESTHLERTGTHLTTRSDSRRRDSRRQLRAAVVGLGWAGSRHAEVYAAHPGVDLAAVVDPNGHRSGAAAIRHRASPFADIKAMLRQVKPDVATVAVPNVEHAGVVCALLDAGCAVLVEKPAAESTRAVDRIESRLGGESAPVVAVGHVERFNPATIAALKVANHLGGILHFEAHRLGPLPPRAASAGVVMESAIHDLDLALYWLGPKTRVQAASIVRDTVGVDVESTALLVAGNQTATVHASWRSHVKERLIRVTTPRATILADLIRYELTVLADDRTWLARLGDVESVDDHGSAASRTHVRLRARNQFKDEQDDFLAAVQHGRSPKVTLADGRRAVQLAESLLYGAAPSSRNRSRQAESLRGELVGSTTALRAVK